MSEETEPGGLNLQAGVIASEIATKSYVGPWFSMGIFLAIWNLFWNYTWDKSIDENQGHFRQLRGLGGEMTRRNIGAPTGNFSLSAFLTFSVKEKSWLYCVNCSFPESVLLMCLFKPNNKKQTEPSCNAKQRGNTIELVDHCSNPTRFCHFSLRAFIFKKTIPSLKARHHTPEISCVSRRAKQQTCWWYLARTGRRSAGRCLACQVFSSLLTWMEAGPLTLLCSLLPWISSFLLLAQPFTHPATFPGTPYLCTFDPQTACPADWLPGSDLLHPNCCWPAIAHFSIKLLPPAGCRVYPRVGTGCLNFCTLSLSSRAWPFLILTCYPSSEKHFPLF